MKSRSRPGALLLIRDTIFRNHTASGFSFLFLICKDRHLESLNEKIKAFQSIILKLQNNILGYFSHITKMKYIYIYI